MELIKSKIIDINIKDKIFEIDKITFKNGHNVKFIGFSILNNDLNLKIGDEIKVSLWNNVKPIIINSFVNKQKIFEINTKNGLTNSQMYVNDISRNSTIKEINFDNRFKKLLLSANVEASRIDLTFLLSDIFTHYSNIRSDVEGRDFFKIGDEFKIK